MGRIISVVFVVILFVACIWWWHNYHAPSPYDGSVHREASTENGATTIENSRSQGVEIHPTPSRSDTPGTINGDPYKPDQTDFSIQTKPVPDLPYAPGNLSSKGRDQHREESDTEYPQPDRRGRGPESPAYNQPAEESQPPDNPNGERFRGDGAYQWYRQGDLTYRLNTRTGQSCIIYATMEEWRKPFVYRHGCRTS